MEFYKQKSRLRDIGEPGPVSQFESGRKPNNKRLMANEKTPNGFHYMTPNDRSTSIIVTGLASMGGTSGSKFDLVDPDSQGTTLLAKINGYFFWLFSGWGGTRLLREGVSLSAIGVLLRHASIETTTLYAKVDVDLLREVALPWPEVQPC